MSNILSNLKIQLRKDTIENWTVSDPILKNGEIAIATDADGNENIKIGNGLSSFTQLKYLNQTEIKSDKVCATEIQTRSISQGYNVKSTPTSTATGVFTEANASFGVVHGIEAQIKSGDDYAFVFNGNNLPLDGQNFYRSHGEGSFSVNPKGGLSGFYVGEDNLSSIISSELETVSSKISDEYVSKDGVVPEAGVTKIASIGGKDIMIPKSSSTIIRSWED